MRKLTVILGSLVLLAGLWAMTTETGRLLAGRWSFTEWAEVDRGTYFRLKVDLTYKGEPQHFDIVVGCNVVGIGYNEGSSTREVGLIPTVYGRSMSDGKGLVVRAPDACKGETTADGRVPPDFMPVMIVYDDADTLGFGTAYISDEAYESPLSLMTFGKATVENATRGEFEDFRQNGEPNLVTREQYHSAQPKDVVEAMGLKKVYPAFGRTCWSYVRYRVPDELRAHVRKYWPATRPEYWTLDSYEAWAELRGPVVLAEPTRRDDEREVRSWPAQELPSYGAIGRDESRLISASSWGSPRAPSFYPVTSDVSAASWPRSPDQWPSFAAGLSHVNIMNVNLSKEATRGFAYCYQRPGFSPTSEEYKILNSRPASFTVDGIPVQNAPEHWEFILYETGTFFERDGFYYVLQEFYLESTRGDV